jgi:hypothetical protein
LILHWDQIPLHYGAEVHRHRHHFEAAGQTTYGLLCCRYAPGDYRLAYSQGEHAEAQLLASANWTAQLPAALADWTPRNNTIVTTVVINRSPCPSCSGLLVDGLDRLHRDHPVAAERGRFVLASRGNYVGRKLEDATKIADLVRLRDAGWELCALQVGGQLSPRGKELLAAIERIAGRGFVRLG